jgi:hypothetical protein
MSLTDPSSEEHRFALPFESIIAVEKISERDVGDYGDAVNPAICR